MATRGMRHRPEHLEPYDDVPFSYGKRMKKWNVTHTLNQIDVLVAVLLSGSPKDTSRSRNPAPDVPNTNPILQILFKNFLGGSIQFPNIMKFMDIVAFVATAMPSLTIALTIPGMDNNGLRRAISVRQVRQSNV